MKNTLILFIFLFSLQATFGQMNLHTEDFETNGEGVTYTSNSFDTGCNDFFERYINGGDNCITNEPTNVNGLYFWGGEDVDQASGGVGELTLNAVNVTGYNLELKVLLAIGRPNDGRFEPSDELLFQYNMDGGGWNTFAAFYGDNDIPMPDNVGNLRQDLDLDGFWDTGAPTVASSDFTDWTFAIPATGNNLEIRMIMGQNTGTEEIMVDFMRINTTTALPIHLADFTVIETHTGSMRINWTTEMEINNKEFTVQRSSNNLVWQDIATVEGAGNSNKPITYSIIDRHPISGTSYYRLKQSDFNGETHFSEIRSTTSNSLANTLSIFPNPVQEQFTIGGKDLDSRDLKIVDLLGKDFTSEVSISPIDDGSMVVHTSLLPAGIYIVISNDLSEKIYVNR